MKELQEYRDTLHVWLTVHKEPDADASRDYWAEYWHKHGELEGAIKALDMITAVVPPVSNKKGGQS